MKCASTLLERAMQGDEQAIHQLMLQYRTDVRRMALSQCSNADDAEDAAQESLLIMYRRIGSLRTLKAFPSWLFTIIRHECHRLAKLKHRWVSSDVDDNGNERLVLETFTEGGMEENLDIAEAISRLSETDRRLILCCHIEQRSVHEAASWLGLSTAAAKSRLHRTRRLLRTRLQAYNRNTLSHTAT